jgi:DNA polymerase-4
MTLRAAEKLCPHALTLPADPAAIAPAAREVLEILGRYTPQVEPEWIHAATGRKAAVTDEQHLARRFGATLDVYGCERLFGPPLTIATSISAALAANGFQARIGVAGNPSLAAVAAAVASLEGPVAVQAGQEQAFLGSLPLTLFDQFDPYLLERLHALGIRTAGQFAHLPERAVLRRFGQAGRTAHEQARGIARRPVVTPPAPGLLEVVCDLEDATGDGLWLDRELSRLAELLAAKLSVRGQSSAMLTLTIALAGHGRGSSSSAGEAIPVDLRSRQLHLKQPVAGAPAILARARELLAQLAPDRPVAGLRLEAAGLGVAATQGSLLPTNPRLAGHERLEVVAHRLRGRFGPRAARRVHLIADAPLPEDRVSWDGPANLVPSRTRRLEVRMSDSGLPLAVRREPRAWEPLRTICSQWRIRTNWWSIPTHRYYYLVETVRGAVLEIYQEQRDGSWYLAGRRD